MTSDKELLKKARAFDHHTLAAIYDQYSPKLYRYAIRLLGDDTQAEDCVAETFSRFLNALQQGGGPKEHLQAYLFRIAHNWITDQYRRQTPVQLEYEEPVESNSQLDPQAVTDEIFLQNRVREALKEITPEQRQVVILKFVEGWSNPEVAKSIGKTEGAVKSLQHRALAALRRVLID